jgi:Flp pilus assembly protein TadB
MMRKGINSPLFWCWLFVVIWLAHVVMTLVMQRWEGLTISLVGLLAALMVASAVQSRRNKNLHPPENS